MPLGMKAELKGLSAQMAEVVGAHLMMARYLIDSDPAEAYRHAEAARRRAARLPITREASAETAYAAEMYEQALAQYRALRRMSGSDDSIPVMVDCLRALGKFREGLDLAEEGMRVVQDPAMRVELFIVLAGLRVDMGQRDEGIRLLRSEIERPTVRHPRAAQARLLYAYADLLDAAGDKAGAYHAFGLAASFDPDGMTAALDRLDKMDGLVLDLDEDGLDEDELDGDELDEDEIEDDGLDQDEMDEDEFDEADPNDDEADGEESFGDDLDEDELDSANDRDQEDGAQRSNPGSAEEDPEDLS